MAAYDYRCRVCGVVFTVHRPIHASAEVPVCPSGHPDVTRVWSAVAVTGRVPAPASSGGGCCGGACGCAG